MPSPRHKGVHARLRGLWGEGAITPAAARGYAVVCSVLPVSDAVTLGRVLITSAHGVRKSALTPIAAESVHLEIDAQGQEEI